MSLGSGPPIGCHPFASIEPAIFLRGPSLLIVPCLKVGLDALRQEHAPWIVERTIAWLNRCRRLAKDWENLNRNALAFLKLASIHLMLRKLCNP